MAFYVYMWFITFAIVSLFYLLGFYDEDIWLPLAIWGSLFWFVLWLWAIHIIATQVIPNIVNYIEEKINDRI